MKKVYYEVLEYDHGTLKNMYYYATDDILKNKRNAEACYKSKISVAAIYNPSYTYELWLTVSDYLQTTRILINQENSDAHLRESKILSELTGRIIEVQQWSEREEMLLQEKAESLSQVTWKR